MSFLKRTTAVGLLCLGAGAGVSAHELNPGYLQLREVQARTFEVMWKMARRGALRLKMRPAFPDTCQATTAVREQLTPGSAVQRWTMRCEEDLTGQAIGIDGLTSTQTDVLVRIEMADGRSLTARLVPTAPVWQVPGVPTWTEVARTYLWLGVEHILLGVDHLLFVLGLLIIVNGTWRLVKTITAFTIAHSITLGGATLGWVSVPARPVNAVVALSILFLGLEIVRSRRGERSLTTERPWLVAFSFGLLHGFGFAGALTARGLPQSEIPLALLFFNAGVEVGQVAFVLLVLAMLWSYRRLEVAWPSWSEPLPAYGIGAMGAFWFITRLLMLLPSSA